MLLRPGSVFIAIIFLLYLKLHISEVQDAKMVEVGPNVRATTSLSSIVIKSTFHVDDVTEWA